MLFSIVVLLFSLWILTFLQNWAAFYFCSEKGDYLLIEREKKLSKYDKLRYYNIYKSLLKNFLWYFHKKSFLLNRQVELAECLSHSRRLTVLRLTCYFTSPTGFINIGFLKIGFRSGLSWNSAAVFGNTFSSPVLWRESFQVHCLSKVISKYRFLFPRWHQWGQWELKLVWCIVRTENELRDKIFMFYIQG